MKNFTKNSDKQAREQAERKVVPCGHMISGSLVDVGTIGRTRTDSITTPSKIKACIKTLYSMIRIEQ